MKPPTKEISHLNLLRKPLYRVATITIQACHSHYPKQPLHLLNPFLCGEKQEKSWKMNDCQPYWEFSVLYCSSYDISRMKINFINQQWTYYPTVWFFFVVENKRTKENQHQGYSLNPLKFHSLRHRLIKLIKGCTQFRKFPILWSHDTNR